MKTQSKVPIGVAELFLQAEKYEDAGNLQMAFSCLSEAAKRGHASSQLNLGNCYASGAGTRRNSAKAAYWYRKAFQNGNEAAARNLAIDRLVAGNTRSAIHWLEKGVENKDGGSYVLLAGIYSKRRGGKSKAVRLLQRVLKLDADCASGADKEDARALLTEIMSRKA